MNNLDKIYSSNIQNFSKDYLGYLSSIFENINIESIELIKKYPPKLSFTFVLRINFNIILSLS